MRGSWHRLALSVDFSAPCPSPCCTLAGVDLGLVPWVAMTTGVSWHRRRAQALQVPALGVVKDSQF